MLTSIGDVMREAYLRGWISTLDGNISLHRKDSTVLYITPSGVRKNIIYPESIVKLKWDTSSGGDKEFTVKSFNSKASTELLMHELLQRTADKTRAVVHLHPTYCVAAMLAGFQLNKLAKHFPELSRYTKVGTNVEVCDPGSIKLAYATYASFTDQVREISVDDAIAFEPYRQFDTLFNEECLLRKVSGACSLEDDLDWTPHEAYLNEYMSPRFDIVGQAGHGVTAIGSNPWECFQHIERLEHCSKIVLASGCKPKDL